MARLQLEIITPDRVVLNTEADYVSLPGVEGEFGILPGHIPYFAALAIGCMHYDDGGKVNYVCMSGGFAEVADNKVHLLVDTAEVASEIDMARAEAAKQRAEKRIADAKQKRGDIDLIRAEIALHKAIVRIDAVRHIR